MRRWNNSDYAKIAGVTSHSPLDSVRSPKVTKEGALLVDRAVLEFALSKGKQKQLATYCKFRHESYLNAGFVTQDMLKSTSQRMHLRWLVSMGWVRKIKFGLYQIVSMKKIARKIGGYRSAAAIALKDWEKDPIAACYGGWISCYARTWKNNYCGAAVSDDLKRAHFVIASAGMIAKILNVTERTVHYWKERAWEYYWQKESVKAVLPESAWYAGTKGGEDLSRFRKRGNFRVLLGPNVYYQFALPAVKRVKW